MSLGIASVFLSGFQVVKDLRTNTYLFQESGKLERIKLLEFSNSQHFSWLFLRALFWMRGEKESEKRAVAHYCYHYFCMDDDSWPRSSMKHIHMGKFTGTKTQGSNKEFREKHFCVLSTPMNCWQAKKHLSDTKKQVFAPIFPCVTFLSWHNLFYQPPLPCVLVLYYFYYHSFFPATPRAVTLSMLWANVCLYYYTHIKVGSIRHRVLKW